MIFHVAWFTCTTSRSRAQPRTGGSASARPSGAREDEGGTAAQERGAREKRVRERAVMGAHEGVEGVGAVELAARAVPDRAGLVHPRAADPRRALPPLVPHVPRARALPDDVAAPEQPPRRLADQSTWMASETWAFSSPSRLTPSKVLGGFILILPDFQKSQKIIEN